jgi:hypothetical protein
LRKRLHEIEPLEGVDAERGVILITPYILSQEFLLENEGSHHTHPVMPLEVSEKDPETPSSLISTL